MNIKFVERIILNVYDPTRLHLDNVNVTSKCFNAEN